MTQIKKTTENVSGINLQIKCRSLLGNIKIFTADDVLVEGLI